MLELLVYPNLCIPFVYPRSFALQHNYRNTIYSMVYIMAPLTGLQSQSLSLDLETRY
jgi:hypothetical protein